MKISKVINNNVISVINEQRKELVIMGKGIGFKKKPGDEVDKNNIEKIFTLDNQDLTDKFKKLFNEIPIEVMASTEKVINHAKAAYNKNLSDSIYVSLSDHIHFAIERHQQGLEMKNALLWEIKRIYRDEFAVGLFALGVIKEELHVELSEDEAGFVAMHIVNAQLNEEIPNVVKITNLIQEILNIVKYHFNTDFDEESMNYYRFVTHLKFFGQRLFSDSVAKNEANSLFELIKEKHQHSFRCVEKIEKYIRKQYNYELNDDEKLYLTIHIERMAMR